MVFTATLTHILTTVFGYFAQCQWKKPNMLKQVITMQIELVSDLSSVY